MMRTRHRLLSLPDGTVDLCAPDRQCDAPADPGGRLAQRSVTRTDGGNDLTMQNALEHSLSCHSLLRWNTVSYHIYSTCSGD